MLKSEIIYKLHNKYNQFSTDDIENLFDIFIKKIVNSLNEGKNIGLILKKIEQEWIKKEYFLSEKNINDIIVKYK